jgi:signal transduction histidine kinase
LGRYEADLVSRFLPQGAVALRNLRRAESLEEQVLVAERKHAMADLARGVAHDVNNALGSVIPLVQQMQEDLRDGLFDPEVYAEDARELERSLQFCRRVFGGMLEFARGARRNESQVLLSKVVANALAIYRRGLELARIDVEVDVPRDLPPLRAIQADIEQLVLNLISNARDAVEAGDTLRIAAMADADAVELVVSDTGRGMDAEQLRRVEEPFFTTKPTGTGLGLAICRSIVAQLRGRFRIESEPGVGTTVRVRLPLSAEDLR